jgi:HK97 family phage prohead protease
MPHIREQYDAFTMPPAVATAGDDDEEPIESITLDGARRLIGYCVVWGAVSDVRRDGFRHRYARGVIRWADVVDALFQHSLANPLGSTRNNTLSVVEDDYGAKATIALDDTTDGENTYKRVKSKLVVGMSFGGVRLSYTRSPDPKIIDITGFVADEVTVTISPGMTETHIVTAENVADLVKRKAAAQRQQLDRIQLRMYSPSR